MFEYAKINTEFKKEMELKNKDIDDFLNKSLFCESTVNKKKLESNFWGKINQPSTHRQLRYIPNSNALNKEILILDKKDIQKNKQKKTINTPKKIDIQSIVHYTQKNSAFLLLKIRVQF